MNNKLKIAYIGQKGIENVIGGVESHVRELAQRTAKAGFEVVVYTRPYTMRKKVKYWNGVTVIRLPSLRTKHLDTISHVFFCTWHALLSKTDIIHYHGVGPALLSFIPRIFRPSTLVIVTFHSIDRQHTKWGLLAKAILYLGEWAACRFPHATITVSEELTNYCLKNYQKKTIFIPNGIVHHQYRKANVIKKNYGLEKNSYLLVLGRLVPHKNIHLVIEAFRKIKTDLKLVIVGEDAFTKGYVAFLKELSQGDQRIIFTGACHGKVLEELVSNCLFFTNASESEGCPTTFIEAMSYGKVVLVRNLKVNREVVKKWGYYFTSHNRDDLRKKMLWLILGKKQLDQKQKKISNYAFDHYAWDNLAPRIFRVYHNYYYNHQILKNPYFFAWRKYKA